jgi:two-component system, LuxR family, response regulator FixJ
MASPSQVVLVVDDDAAVRSALKFLLEIEGFDVRLYDSAAAVLADRLLPAEACLVADYRMPGMDGLQLVDALHARQVEIPAILIISERADDQLTRRARRSGIHEILEKPLSDSALVESIRHALAAAP